MSAPPTQLALFDYATLDSETRIVVQQRTSEIKGLMRRAAQDIIDIGQKLIDVKARLGHGNFGVWLRAEFEWSSDTAGNFMRVAHRFGDIPKISDFAPSALYLLAAPSTPEPARIEALERAADGEPISFTAAREIVQAHKAPTSSAYEVIESHVAEAMQQRTASVPPSPPAPMAVHFSSATPEWYTPRHVIDRVVYLFGHIDLDPCSNGHGEAANVPARFHYTAEDNGLTQSWRAAPWVDDHGEVSDAVRVYMNPPYGDEIGAWVDRLVRAYTSGEITAAVALLPARVDTAWWRKLRQYPVCFVAGRLKFSGSENSAPFPSAIVCLGCAVDDFCDAFEDLGVIYTPAPLRRAA